MEEGGRGETPRALFRSALSFFSGTLASRISGMVRDMVMAFYFGASAELGAFLAAYRFVYLMRRLFGEGTLHQGIIPHFEASRKNDPKKGALFFRDLFSTVTLFLFLLILVIEGILFSFFHGETALFAKWMLPGIFFICLFGVTTSLLQSQKLFFLSASAPVIANLVWIIGMICFHVFPKEQALIALSAVISCAFFAQFLVVTPPLFRFLKETLSLKEIFRPQWSSSAELKQLIKPVLIATLAVAAVQVNSAVDSIFARYVCLEGPAYLWYAIRLWQLPLSLFAIALSSALLPSLSRAYERGDETQYQLLSYSAQVKTVILIIPCVVGIFVLGAPSIALIFGRGEFNQISFFYTTTCLWGYGIGLLPAALVQVVAPMHYARKSYRLPATAAIASALLNTALNALFVFYFHFGVLSIALATSCASCCNIALLYYKSEAKFGTAKQLWKEGGKSTLAALLAGAVTLYMGYYFLADPTCLLLQGKINGADLLGGIRSTFRQGTFLGAEALIFFAVFLGACKTFKVRVW